MSRLATLVWLAVAAVACRGPAPARSEGSCTHIQAERALAGAAVCEDVWSCSRPPGGRFDRIGLRRLALCDGAPGAVVLYLPGMHMNAELPFTEPRRDLRLYLAQAGMRVWGLDYRTHSVPPDAAPADLAALGGWTTDRFTDDVAWAAGFVRGAEQAPLVVAGFSQGAAFAYRLASRDAGLAGLVILDGAIGAGRAPEGGGPAIDVGGNRLPYAERQQLLARVKADPRAASPVAGYPSAGAALADILYTAPAFGGQGGLANGARISDIQSLATLLATYDRWWPRRAVDGSAPRAPARQIPVLAFASSNLGREWIERVRTMATTYGGPTAIVRELPGYGHLDVLVAQRAPQDVYEPTRAFLESIRR